MSLRKSKARHFQDESMWVSAKAGGGLDTMLDCVELTGETMNTGRCLYSICMYSEVQNYCNA